MRIGLRVAALVLPLLGGGCLAKTAWDVATLPVKATGQAVDWATTSQEEADRNYGRKMRKKEAAEGRRLREEERRRKREEREAREDEDD